MSQNRFVFEGLAEFKEALRNLPQELKREASNLALAAANAAAHDIRRGYPRSAESLAQAVTVQTDDPAPLAAGATVRQKHSWRGSLRGHGGSVLHHVTRQAASDGRDPAVACRCADPDAPADAFL